MVLFPTSKFEPVAGNKFQFDDNDSENQKEWVVTKVAEGKTFAHAWTYRQSQLNIP